MRNMFSAHKLGFIVLISIFAVTATVGEHLPVFGLNGLRAFTLVLVLTLHVINWRAAIPVSSPIVFSHFMLFWLWIFWGLLLTLIIATPESAVRELFELSFGALLVAVPILFISKDVANINIIKKFWVFSFWIATSFAAFEWVTGVKLESNFVRTQDAHVFNHFFLISTFDNPNGYAVFLLLSLPFIVLRSKDMETPSPRYFEWISIVLLGVQLALTGSRAGIIGFILFFLIKTLLERKFRRVVISAFLLTIFMFVVPLFFDVQIVETFAIAEKIKNSGSDLEYGSSRERYNLLVNSLHMIVESYFVGVGPGQFGAQVISQTMPYQISVPNPHSMLLEISTQYGILIIFGFVYCLFGIGLEGVKTISKRRTSHTSNAHFGSVLISGLVAFVISLNISSTYMTSQFSWIFWGSLAALALMLERRRRLAMFSPSSDKPLSTQTQLG